MPTKRRKVLQRAFDELVIEFCLHNEHALPVGEQRRVGPAGLDLWVSQWETHLRWHIQRWMIAGDTDPASIKKRGRELLGVPSRFYMKPKPIHSQFDYTARLAAYEATHGKAFGA